MSDVESEDGEGHSRKRASEKQAMSKEAGTRISLQLGGGGTCQGGSPGTQEGGSGGSQSSRTE